jgi:hypothetical protein
VAKKRNLKPDPEQNIVAANPGAEIPDPKVVHFGTGGMWMAPGTEPTKEDWDRALEEKAKSDGYANTDEMMAALARRDASLPVNQEEKKSGRGGPRPNSGRPTGAYVKLRRLEKAKAQFIALEKEMEFSEYLSCLLENAIKQDYEAHKERQIAEIKAMEQEEGEGE